jgi:hypothetical protein
MIDARDGTDRFFVPVEHGIDGFRECGTTPLIDATGINPCVLPAIWRCLITKSLDLRIAYHLRASPSLQVLETGLFILPAVREDGIAEEFVESKSGGI